MPLIESRHLVDAEPLRQGDHRGVRRSQRKVVVLRNQLCHPGEVLRLQRDRFEVTISNGLQERRPDTRTKQCRASESRLRVWGRISSAVLVQVKGWQRSFQATMNARMALTSWPTLSKLPRRMA